MGVGVALSELRRQLRAEVGQSLNVQQGVNAQGQYDLILARQQQELWQGYEWPHLRYYAELDAAAGQALYDYPAGMPFEAINKVWVSQAPNNPVFVPYGIDPNKQLLGASGQRAWPPQAWGNRPVVDTTGATPVVTPAGKFEISPLPSQAGLLLLEGQAPCNPLIADTDIAIIDSTAITLFAAAEILADQKRESASTKLQKANQYLRRLLADQGAMKRRVSVLGGAQIVEAMMGPDYSNDVRRFRTPTE
jgi:hypothetical protein